MYQDLMQQDNFSIYGNGYDSVTEPEQVEIDNRLGRGIADDDERAFTLFVKRWHGFAVRYVRRRFSYYADMADVQEIANDVFLHLREASKKWLHEKRYASVDFVRFFYGVMRLQTTWKLQKVRKRNQRGTRNDAVMRDASNRVTIDNVDFVDFDADLCDAFLKLKPRTRLTFILRHIEGYRTKDVAQIMNMSGARVTYHDKTACKRLQKLLAEYE